VRPTDLSALVAFDEEVYENHAYARERLARPGEAPRPLSATIEQWLGRGRRTWIDVRGRQIEGIATARELGSRVWVMDTLIDASSGEGAPPGAPRNHDESDVFVALLRKARDAASEEQITHLLLRTHLDSSAHTAAMHCGFKQVRVEETWAGDLAPSAASSRSGLGSLEGAGAFSIRRAGDEDDFGRFQLFNHILPLDAREALALTLEEWQRTRERRWLQRGGSEWVALDRDTVAGTLQMRSGDPAQLEVLTETRECAAALLDHATSALRRRGASSVLAVAPASVPAIGAELAARGLERQDEFALLCLRLAHPVPATARVRSSLAVPTRG
jgi:hypothetical protein